MADRQTTHSQHGTGDVEKPSDGGEDCHHPRYKLAEIIREVRDNGGDEPYVRLWAWCDRFVKRWFRTSLEQIEVDEIVSDALAETYAELSNPKSSEVQVANVIIRALEKLKKRKQRKYLKAKKRGLNRTVESLEDHPELEAETSEARTRFQLKRLKRQRDRFQGLLGIVFSLLEVELPKLRERYRELILHEYQLPGDQFRPLAPREDFPNPAAKRKARYRARRALSDRLEERIEEQLEGSDGEHRKTLEEALEVIRADWKRELKDTNALTELARAVARIEKEIDEVRAELDLLRSA